MVSKSKLATLIPNCSLNHSISNFPLWADLGIDSSSNNHLNSLTIYPISDNIKGESCLYKGITTP